MYILSGYIFFYIIFIITYFYTLEINQKLDKILLLFYIALTISSVLGLLLLDHSRSPIFCGGIPVIYLPFDFIQELYSYEKNFDKIRLTFDEFIFHENSHLGMIAPGCIIFSIYQISKNRTHIWFNILFLVFIAICILKNSTTLMIGTICSLIFLTLFNYKYFSKNIILIFTLIVIIFSSIIYSSRECSSRLIPLYYNGENNVNQQEEINDKITSKKIFETSKDNEERYKNFTSYGIKKKICL